jgi:hypothetical protein
MVDMDAQILAAAKVLPDATKIELFDRNNFKRWQQKVLFFFFFSFFFDPLHFFNNSSNFLSFIYL